MFNLLTLPELRAAYLRAAARNTHWLILQEIADEIKLRQGWTY